MKTFFGELRRRNVVRVGILYAIVGWLVLQVADLAMPRLGIPAWGVTLVLLLVALGLPIALVFAWAFELTPEGIKRTHEVEHHESITHLTGRKLDFFIIGVLAAALLYVVIDSYVLRDRAATSAPAASKTAAGLPLVSIAVLPFVDMSQAKDQEYLADGISEELLNVLARIEGYKVAGRTSAFAFKGRDEDLRSIGQKLNVENILEGSVRKQGERIRVTAQLVKATDGYHLWSDTYDRHLDDVFAIQDDIARQVVAAIQDTLGVGATKRPAQGARGQAPTSNVEAWTHYLRGQHLLRNRTRATMEASLKEFERAVALDPEFSRAHVGVANSLILLAHYGHLDLANVEGRIRQELDRARALDPDVGETYAMRAQLLSDKLEPPEEQIVLLERAVELNPGDTQSLLWLAMTYGEAGRPKEEMRTYARAYAADPLLPTLLMNYAVASQLHGDQAMANRIVSELEALQSDSPVLYRTRAFLGQQSGRVDEWVRWTAMMVKQDPTDVGAVTMQLQARLWLGDAEGAQALSRRLSELIPGSPRELAARISVHDFAGDRRTSAALISAGDVPFGDDEDFLLAKSVSLLRHGENAQALAALLTALPQYREPQPKVSGGPTFFVSPNAVFLLDKVGQTSQAAAVADAAIRFADATFSPQQGREQGPSLVVRARIAAARGDRATMLAQLRQLYDTGGAIHAFVAVDPLIEPFRGDPTLEDLLARFDARRAEWRRQLAAEGL